MKKINIIKEMNKDYILLSYRKNVGLDTFIIYNAISKVKLLCAGFRIWDNENNVAYHIVKYKVSNIQYKEVK